MLEIRKYIVNILEFILEFRLKNSFILFHQKVDHIRSLQDNSPLVEEHNNLKIH